VSLIKPTPCNSTHTVSPCRTQLCAAASLTPAPPPKDTEELLDVFRDGTELRVAPLLQHFLFPVCTPADSA